MKKLSRTDVRLLLAFSVFLTVGLLFALTYFLAFAFSQLFDLGLKSNYSEVTIDAPQGGRYKLLRIEDGEVFEGKIPNSIALPPGSYKLDLILKQDTLTDDEIVVQSKQTIAMPDDFLNGQWTPTEAQDEVFDGGLCEYGWGTTEDYNAALIWYHKAADGGSAEGEYRIGRMYQLGEGVDQDYVEAMKWYKNASNEGDAEADFAIGQLYYNGYGTVQNKAEAMKWYKKAADSGNPDAIEILKKMQ